jgi:hypothetical protein
MIGNLISCYKRIMVLFGCLLGCSNFMCEKGATEGRAFVGWGKTFGGSEDKVEKEDLSIP